MNLTSSLIRLEIILVKCTTDWGVSCHKHKFRQETCFGLIVANPALDYTIII